MTLIAEASFYHSTRVNLKGLLFGKSLEFVRDATGGGARASAIDAETSTDIISAY